MNEFFTSLGVALMVIAWCVAAIISLIIFIVENSTIQEVRRSACVLVFLVLILPALFRLVTIMP